MKSNIGSALFWPLVADTTKRLTLQPIPVTVMLGASALFVAAVTALLVEGSIVFYRLPIAPAWLRRRKDLQTSFSSVLTIGFVASLFMMGQYLVDLGDKPFAFSHIAAMAAVVVAFVAAWRRLRKLEREIIRKPETTTAARTTPADSDVRRAA